MTSPPAATRLAILYAAIFGATGVSLPFAAVWFREQGLSGAEIGLVLALPMLARLVTGPVIAVWSDGFRLRRTPLVILATVAALAYALAGLVQGLALWLPVWFVAATAAAAIIPLADVLALKLSRDQGFAFARPRAVGSVAFIAANVSIGAILLSAPVDAILVWIVVAMAGAAVLAGWQPPVPALTGTEPRRDRFAGLGRLLGDRPFMVAIFAIGLIQAAHAFYYGFSAIIWRGQGLTEATIGLLWGVSVAAEVALMWWIEPWRRRRGIPARTLVLIGAAAAVLRWIALSLAPPLWLLWPLQALHALSFAAVFLAGLELVERLGPPQSATVAQTLNSTLSSGVLIGLATLVSGPLYDAAGTGGYLAMAVMAGLGGLLALRISRAGG